MELVACLNKPGVTAGSVYPAAARRGRRQSLATLPACGSPYMPLSTLAYTWPCCQQLSPSCIVSKRLLEIWMGKRVVLVEIFDIHAGDVVEKALDCD
jgi:hypothetical protein